MSVYLYMSLGLVICANVIARHRPYLLIFFMVLAYCLPGEIVTGKIVLQNDHKTLRYENITYAYVYTIDIFFGQK